MSTNDSQEEVIVDEESAEEIADIEETDATDWKAEALKAQAIAKRFKTKLEKSGKVEKPADAKPEPTQKKSGDLDAGQLALLRVDGIKGKEELALVREYLSSGKELLDVMENKHFLNDLKDLREARETKEAIPSSTKRSGSSAKDSVEYWSGKYATGTPLNDVPRELRMKVLSARVQGEKGNGMFYNSNS